MRLEIFDFIDDVIEVYDEKNVILREGSKEITHFFEDYFLQYDNIINISGRLKSYESLKEKILRQDFYLLYETPENAMENLNDLVGLRLECRFIEDEKDVYEKIQDFFDIEDESLNGYYYNQNNQDLLLNLGSPQPEVQKNGFYIYKMNGIYRFGEEDINFELQIKSMVNVFWGEVEHKILYKNYKYMLSEDLFKNMMASLMESLTMIDTQLMILNNHLREIDQPSTLNNKEQIESILSKIVYDIYSKETKEEFGFSVDYKDACDTVISYILNKDRDIANYDINFLNLLKKILKIDDVEIEIGNYMDFEEDVEYEDDFTREIGDIIYGVLNKDFKWNLFFNIIFTLETGKKHIDFLNFINYFRDSFLYNLEHNEDLNTKFEEDEKEKIIAFTMDLIRESFVKSRKLSFLTNENIEDINDIIRITIKKFTCYDMWCENEAYYKSELNRVLFFE